MGKALGWGCTLLTVAGLAVAMNTIELLNWRGLAAGALITTACALAWAQGRYTDD